MADQTSIEWTDATWTPVKGCTRASEGCRNCYAEIMTARFSKPGMWGEGLAEIVETPNGKDHRWTGVLKFDEKELLKPLRWKKPRKIFVCSTSDLFHEKVQDEWIDKVFAIMALCPQHTFQVLTKRADRLHNYFSRYDAAHDHNCADMVADAIAERLGRVGAKGADRGGPEEWPLPNVWLGVSVEDQKRADERIPYLLETPARTRFLSCEPLLACLDLNCIEPREGPHAGDIIDCLKGDRLIFDEDGELDSMEKHARIDWVIAGGESGPGARPMHPEWVRELRDECERAGVAFLFKQWGDWKPLESNDGFWPTDKESCCRMRTDGKRADEGWPLQRIGKGAAGKTLDGIEHLAYPEPVNG